MKKLLRQYLLLSLVFLLAAAGVLLFYMHLSSEPPLLQDNAAFRTSVDSIKDIEHLRKVLYTVVAGTDKSVVAIKAALDSAMYFLVFVLLAAAAAFGYGYLLLRKVVAREGAPKNDGAL